MKNSRILLLVLAVGLMALGGKYMSSRMGRTDASPSKASQIVFYQDSMHPWIKSDKPGKCTVCLMDLTPIAAGQKGFDGADTVVLRSNAITVANIRTAKIGRQPLHRTVQVAGMLEPNETRKAILSAPAMGRADQLLVDTIGVEVTNGQPLVMFYSPSWSTRRLYLQGRTATPRTPGAEMESVPGQQVHTGASEPDGRGRPGANFLLDLTAPQAGIILERSVLNGQYVQEGEKLFTIVDPSILWFRFEVYEQQLPWLEVGQKIEITIPSAQGQKVMAAIDFIEPTLNEATRTVRVRANVNNPQVMKNGQRQRQYRFGTYAAGQVDASSGTSLGVPRDAVMFPGGDAYVFVAKGDGVFQKRRLKLGRQGDSSWEVVSGLEEGEEVVTSGNVLIDAQSQFNQSGEITQDAEPGESHSGADALTGAMPASENGKGDQQGKAAGVWNPGTQPIATRSPQRQNPSPARSSEDVVVPELTAEQKQALDEFLELAGKVSETLAADQFAKFNSEFARLPAVVSKLRTAFPAGHPWHQLVLHFDMMGRTAPAKDLASARKTFLLFSTNAAELAKRVRRAGVSPAALKLFHCPMAPKPGLWVQMGGPLHNPYFGADMLSCGQELKP